MVFQRKSGDFREVNFQRADAVWQAQISSNKKDLTFSGRWSLLSTVGFAAPAGY